MEKLTWKKGEFCWVDLMTSDLDAARKFYTDIFGWSYSEMKTPEGPYLFSSIPEGDVCGLGVLNESLKAKGGCSYWSVYVLTDNVDEASSKAQNLGGKVVTEAFDVMDVGRMAVIASPSGATFCLWQLKDKSKDSPRVFGFHHGMYGWVELCTHDMEKDEKFYCDLFGWSCNQTEMEDGGEYREFKIQESKFPVAGMMAAIGDMKGQPSGWMVYFTVKNIANVVKEIRALGGKVTVKPFEVKGVGIMAAAQDPTGANFCLAEWDAEALGGC